MKIEIVTKEPRLAAGTRQSKKIKLHAGGMCQKGLHVLTEDTIYINPNNGKRRCLTCKLQNSRDWHNLNKDKARAGRIQRRFNMSLEEYDNLLNAQNNKCRICGRDFMATDRLAVPCIDHDHNTGLVRGILCTGCNVGLGFFDDNINSLTAAIEYLSSTGKN